MRKHLKTIVCGTRFGENYISALLEEDSSFKLSGLLARGSARSQALAADLDVVEPAESPAEQIERREQQLRRRRHRHVMRHTRLTPLRHEADEIARRRTVAIEAVHLILDGPVLRRS